MKVDCEGWVPLADYASEQFVSGYTGNFAQMLQVNQPRLGRFLNLASLDGRALLTDKTSSRHRAVNGELNSDGSLSGRKGLRWGDKIETRGDSCKKP